MRLLIRLWSQNQTQITRLRGKSTLRRNALLFPTQEQRSFVTS
jgi:hypothetical protein